MYYIQNLFIESQNTSIMHIENRFMLFSKSIIIIILLIFPVFISLSDGLTKTESIQDFKDKVSISKSVYKDKISNNDSAIITVSVKNNNNLLLEDIIVTDTVPRMFDVYPSNSFSNNVIKMNLESINNSYIFSYGITSKPAQNFDRQIISLPPASIQYKIEKNNLTINDIKMSNTEEITIESIKKDWINTDWGWYVAMLLAIAGTSGFVGGIINHIIGYRVILESVIKNSILKSSDERFEFDIRYVDNIPIGEITKIIINNIKPEEPGSLEKQITCTLYYGNEASTQSYTIRGNGEIHFIIERENTIIQIFINDYPQDLLKLPLKIGGKKRGLKENAIAGFASGLVVLLALLVASSFVTNHTYPANVQSMITLIVSSIVAGFIPFQILDRATGQLADKIKIIPKENPETNALLKDFSLMNVNRRISILTNDEMKININNLSPRVKKFLGLP
jgi:hypothetical protein